MAHLLENSGVAQQRHRKDHASGRQDEEGGVTRGSPGPLGTASPPDGSLGGLRAGRGHGGWELTDGVSIYMEPSYVRGGGDAPWGEPQASEEDSGSIATL